MLILQPEGFLGFAKKHKNRLVECTEKVVYSISLSCGKQYVGQTGRSMTDRLREHYYNVNRVVSGHLGNALTREIIESEMIARLKEDCVSAPSVSLSGKESKFLARRQHSR